MLQEIIIPEFKNTAGTTQKIGLSYQVFGQPFGTAPVVLVNHSLTGNSQVIGENGWWNAVVGAGKSVDTEVYSIICFNIPGNGYSGKKEHLIHNYKEFSLRDIARIFLIGLEELGIQNLYAAIGGSIGGAVAWELAALQPGLIQHLIPIATDYKATDWVLAHCKVQDQILNNSVTPVHDARLHAMTFYRTPQSLTRKFGRNRDAVGEFQVHRWLSHHGEKLDQRFKQASYKLMNHLLTTIDISGGTGKHLEAAGKIEGDIHIVTINSDWFFLAEENWESFVELSLIKKNISIHEIRSVHGHDAFLIEDRQLCRFLKPIFHQKKVKNEEDTSRAVWNR